MVRTSKQELDDKIEDLQLKLIEENAAIDALMPVTEQEFLGHDPERAQERRLHEGKRDGITKQIAFLTAKISQTSKSPGRSQKPKTTKQSDVYRQVTRMKRRNPKLTNAEAIGQLAEKQDDSEDAIRKAFYAEQKRLNDETTRAARDKRESEDESDQQDQGEKQSP
jgi:hypothetical protein